MSGNGCDKRTRADFICSCIFISVLKTRAIFRERRVVIDQQILLHGYEVVKLMIFHAITSTSSCDMIHHQQHDTS